MKLFFSKIFISFQRFLRNSKATDGDHLSLADFIHYVREHEKNLRLHFSNLDKNKDGEYSYHTEKTDWIGNNRCWPWWLKNCNDNHNNEIVDSSDNN